MKKRIVIGFRYKLEYLNYLPECDREYIKTNQRDRTMASTQ